MLSDTAPGAGQDALTGALRHHFGFQRFRAGQREIIETVLAGRSAVALLPTGGGKSLCYQLPALLSEGVARDRPAPGLGRTVPSRQLLRSPYPVLRGTAVYS